MELQIKQLVDGAKKILVVQADNPDADSLASALALEQILGDQGKDIYLYCGIDMPSYLRYLSGWDRVSAEFPDEFDLSIIVDTSSMTLLQKLSESGNAKKLARKPCIIFDHHIEVGNVISFATYNLTRTDVSSTGELIYSLSQEVNWPVDKTAANYIMTSILGDTQGLTNDLTTAQTYRVMAELVELGVNRPQLEESRREYTKMHRDIFRYKAELIKRTEIHVEGKLALIDIPNDEIMKYSPLYNPNALIQFEHLQIEGVLISIAIKHYNDGRLTASIRCNTKAPIASQVAERFDGGGHTYAAGFKIEKGASISEVKNSCIQVVSELLNIT